MCSGPKTKPTQSGFMMEGESHKEDGQPQKLSVLLELSASNDLIGFKTAVEEEGHDVDEPSLWYGRRLGSKKMGFEERTPLLIASMFGSKDVVNYIVESGRVDVNRACGSDGATALHCAAAGGSFDSAEVVKILLDASAYKDSLDANGNRPGDLIAPACNLASGLRKKMLESLLNGSASVGEIKGLPAQVGNEMEGQELQENSMPRILKDGTEKKEYPVDLTLPDIKNGIYGTDEFRMYTFKVKPCSRAYSHDWTECPFVHPGENARRRDPRKYHYSCVPCPEFRKGSCRQGDNCEYAHGIFECWLHPAQYRTRLCKDDTNCTRRVCFFAHKPEELRPLYASIGSAVPSPRSYSATGSSLDMGLMSPLALGSPSVMIPPTSTPPLTPTGTSPIGGTMWPNQSNIIPPTLQLPGSRLKTALRARDMDLDMELLGLESHLRHQQQQLIDEISGLSSPTSWSNPLSTAAAYSASADQTGELNRFGGMKPTNLEDIFGFLDPSILPQLQEISHDAAASQLQSPTGVHTRPDINQQLRASYPTNPTSSPVRASPSFGIDPSGPTAAAVLSSRSAAFALEELEIVERLPVNAGVKLLANEEFDKETGGYESEAEEDKQELKPLENQAQEESTPIENKVSKKRKARDKLPSSRRKKSKLASAEKSPVSEDDGFDVHPKKRKSSNQQTVIAKEKVVEKDKPVDVQGEAENSSNPETDESSDDETNVGRFSQLQKTGKGSVDVSMTTTEVKKLPSRSARRKKAKRRWLREQAKIEKEKLQSKQLHGIDNQQVPAKDSQQSPAKDNLKLSEEHLQSISNNDAEDNVVPIVVRPGHIRFEPLEKEDAEEAVQQSQISVKTFQWNGITSKKKGQKWGMEKTTFLKRNDKSFSKVSSEMVDVDENATVTDKMDFDKLMPYSSLPKEGDLVAYRLIELSSSWTPELCSFRVGKISHYDAESNRIILTMVPGYPNASEKNIDQEASELLDTSLYGEDGSLEIDYSSLVDVRLVKHGNSNAIIAIADGSNKTCAQDQDILTSPQPNGSKEAAIVSAAPPAQANGVVNPWEEINQALSAKKAELSKEDGWSQADSSGRSSWSYRALRRSALGPTMAFLRAQNGI